MSVSYQGGAFTSIGTVGNAGDGSSEFTFAGGPFDTLRVTNGAGTITDTCQGPDGSYECGGFDVNARWRHADR